MTTPALTVRSLLSQDNVKSKFEEILRDRAAGFTANLAVLTYAAVTDEPEETRSYPANWGFDKNYED